MTIQLITWLDSALEALNQSTIRIVWNLFLAFIPLILSFWLFRQSTSRSFLWWTGFLIFLFFLPNAPYILTDTIHIPELLHQGYSASIIWLAVVPQYIIFVLTGFEAYVISLMLANNYLVQQGQEKYVFLTNLIIHSLCAVGIYLGRLERFNSWDLIAQPYALVDALIHKLVGQWQIFSMAVTFVVLFVLFWLVKLLNLAILNQIKSRSTLAH